MHTQTCVVIKHMLCSLSPTDLVHVITPLYAPSCAWLLFHLAARPAAFPMQPHVLDAVLLLLKELDPEELQVVRKATDNRLRSLRRRDCQAAMADVIQQ